MTQRRLHDDAVRVLSDYSPGDTQQARLRDEYLDFLATHDDAMRRSCVAGHVTASTLVLSHDRREVLLTLHPKVGRWLQLGGHCEDDDATVRDAALREAREESGVDELTIGAAPVALDRHHVGCHGGSWLLDVQYVAVAKPSASPVQSQESADLAWWPVDDLPDDADDALRRLVAAALQP